MKIAVFASGNGSNFEAIAAAFSQKKIAGQLSLVFCDQPEAYVLTRAKKRKIPVVHHLIFHLVGSMKNKY